MVEHIWMLRGRQQLQLRGCQLPGGSHQVSQVWRLQLYLRHERVRALVGQSIQGRLGAVRQPQVWALTQFLFRFLFVKNH